MTRINTFLSTVCVVLLLRVCERCNLGEAENRRIQKGDLAATLRVISITFLVGPLRTDTLRGTMRAFPMGATPNLVGRLRKTASFSMPVEGAADRQCRSWTMSRG